MMDFKDHFTLEWPSSRIRFHGRAGAARVVETDSFQLVMEEMPGTGPGSDPSILIRRANESTMGLTVLRCLCAVVTTFWTGTLLVFSVQVLFLLFVHLAIELGLTGSTEQARARGFASLLSIIPFLRGLSHLLAKL